MRDQALLDVWKYDQRGQTEMVWTCGGTAAILTEGS